jgi:hypothetical protein
VQGLQLAQSQTGEHRRRSQRAILIRNGSEKRLGGARVEIEFTTLYELRDGKIVLLHQLNALAEALEAAGLRE